MDLHDQYEKAYKERPHVVILGAGASVATIPNGDKNGLKTSVMDGFLEKLGMLEIINNLNLKTKSNNLEDIYSELHEDEHYADIRNELDKKIRDYFNQFQIPDNPTIYDFLILSLRKKDLIATFNWDPLLLQAYIKVSKITNELPQLAFLHGNVMIGYCDLDRIEGSIGDLCPICNSLLTPSRLLYPIKHKNYNQDLYTKANWNKLKRFLSNAYLVTIFGYSAPKSDIEAIDMIKDAWGDIEKRNMEDFEFIDIKSEDEIVDTWNKFIHTHHYSLTNNFFNSVLATFPRRTTEELFDRTQNVKWLSPDDKTKFTSDLTFEDLSKIIDNLVDEEDRFKDSYITLEGA
ncbi:hypothetical protein MLC52_06215 [Sulfurimonas sp. NW15]|uniref:hypothetical protein n=1 Tax=Sulfurimonas sp. NW15 TaxID=2922729 RepID=UPI003DA95B8D